MCPGSIRLEALLAKEEDSIVAMVASKIIMLVCKGQRAMVLGRGRVLKVDRRVAPARTSKTKTQQVRHSVALSSTLLVMALNQA